jgi:hypothetical protein
MWGVVASLLLVASLFAITAVSVWVVYKLFQSSR